MKSQRPITTEEEHRVLPFRPRTLPVAPGWRKDPDATAQHDDTRPEPYDLSRYERDREEPDDFRHRMLANIAAFAFTGAFAQETAKQDLKKAGTETKSATKHAGKAVAKGAHKTTHTVKKGVNKSAIATEKGAHKVKTKTSSSS